MINIILEKYRLKKAKLFKLLSVRRKTRSTPLFLVKKRRIISKEFIRNIYRGRLAIEPAINLKQEAHRLKITVEVLKEIVIPLTEKKFAITPDDFLTTRKALEERRDRRS